MGTRGSVIIFQEGKAKGYYNNYDSYPSGLGEDVITALQEIDAAKNGWEQFAKNTKKVKLVNEDKKPSKKIQEKYKEFSDTTVSTGNLEEWYVLLRNLQEAEYIKTIMAGKVEHMLNGTNFIKDSLFCEYAYVIDLDTMVLEFYKGFQEIPQASNRFGVVSDGGYYPCAKVGEIPLKGISKNKLVVEQMMAFYNEEE